MNNIINIIYFSYETKDGDKKLINLHYNGTEHEELVSVAGTYKITNPENGDSSYFRFSGDGSGFILQDQIPPTQQLPVRPEFGPGFNNHRNYQNQILVK